MTTATSTSTFPTSPFFKIPNTPLTTAALAYTRLHTSPGIVNHCLRSTAFALIIATKIPSLATIDAETLVLATILHDLGWANATAKASSHLISADKRFEVDGANAAREFLGSVDGGNGQVDGQLLWDAIALHTTPSISFHKQAEVACTTYGIMGDFFGPNMPGGVIDVEEYRDVVKLFPRDGFREELVEVMCGLCREKPETTYDNFVGEFGVKFLGGEYKEGWEGKRTVDFLLGGLDGCAKFAEG